MAYNRVHYCCIVLLRCVLPDIYGYMSRWKWLSVLQLSNHLLVYSMHLLLFCFVDCGSCFARRLGESPWLIFPGKWLGRTLWSGYGSMITNNVIMGRASEASLFFLGFQGKKSLFETGRTSIGCQKTTKHSSVTGMCVCLCDREFV